MGVILDTDNEIKVHHEMSRVIMEDAFGVVANLSQEQAVDLANLLLNEAGKISDA